MIWEAVFTLFQTTPSVADVYLLSTVIFLIIKTIITQLVLFVNIYF